MEFSFPVQTATIVLLIVLFVYCPGRLFLRLIRLSATPFETGALSLTAGTASLIGTYWLLASYQAAAWLPLLGLLAGGAEWVCSLRVRSHAAIPEEGTPPPGRMFWLMVAAAIVLHGVLMFPSGIHTEWGFLLYGTHAADAPSHVFIMQNLARGFPSASPGFSGHLLENYHFFFALFWGALLRLAPLNVWDCYFRFSPAFSSLLLCLTAYLAAAGWTGSRKAGWAATGMTAFFSSFGVLFALASQQGFPTNWDGNLWLQSPATLVVNPPAFLAFSFLFAGWRTLHGWVRNRDWTMLAATVLLWGILPGVKMHAALLVMAGLAAGGFWEALFQHRFRLWTAGLCLLPLYLFQIRMLTSTGPSLLVFFPGFTLAAMLFLPNMIGLMTASQLGALYDARPVCAALLVGGLIPIFALGNLGLRIIGLPSVIRDFLRPRVGDPMMFFLLAMGGAGLVLVTLFIQAGAGQWNTIQFYYFVVLLSALPAGRTLSRWLDRLDRPRQAVVWTACFAIGFTPIAHDLWRSGMTRTAFAFPPPMTAACQWLRTRAPAGSVILNPLPESLSRDGYHSWKSLKARASLRSRDEWKAVASERRDESESPTNPKSVFRSGRRTIIVEERPNATMVAALTGHATYLEQPLGTLQRTPTAPLDERIQAVIRFYADPRSAESRDFLKRADIDWVIMPDGHPDLPDPAAICFQTDGVRVFDVRDYRGQTL